MTEARLFHPKATPRSGTGAVRETVPVPTLPDWLLSPMTGRRAAMLCGVFALAALLGGCQIMAPVGEWTERQMDAGWRGTKSLVASMTKPLPLRSAPRDMAVFHHADTHDAGLNTKALERAVWIAKLNHMESVSLEAIDRTLDNGVMVFRPGSGARRIDTRPTYRPALRQPYGAAPIVQQPRRAPAQPEAVSPEAVSYVKLDGSLDMADWSACEGEVGGAFLVSPAGTRVAPDFDACMRSKGYVDEGEAERRLSR